MLEQRCMLGTSHEVAVRVQVAGSQQGTWEVVGVGAFAHTTAQGGSFLVAAITSQKAATTQLWQKIDDLAVIRQIALQVGDRRIITFCDMP